MFRKKKGPLHAYSDVQPNDMKVLQALFAHGADLADPRHVLHFVYVPAEADARTLSTSAAEWQGTAKPHVEGFESWTVVFERHDYVLSPENVKADALLFSALADSVSGKYDGWEASV